MKNHSMCDAPCPACGDIDGCHIPAKVRDNRLSLSEFWDALSEWSQRTFGSDKDRGERGPLKHLAKEVQEALKASERDESPLEELADCLFLVFDATRRSGHTYRDLERAVNEKLKVNKARLWPKPSRDEPVEHIR